MSDKNSCRASSVIRLVSMCSVMLCCGVGYAAIDGTDVLAIDGTDARAIDGTDLFAIDGTDVYAIDGTDARAIDGTDARAIDGTDARAIDGTDARAIDGTDARAIDGTDARAIDGTDARAIDGTDARAIDGTDARAIDGTDLLVVGRVDFVDADFISVLGQTVLGVDAKRQAIGFGTPVAVYGSIDRDTGGIVNASVVRVAGGDLSYLRGVVDEVNRATGRAVVSGVTVDYNALLSNGQAPNVGDEVAVTGRAYKELGLLVAQP